MKKLGAVIIIVLLFALSVPFALCESDMTDIASDSSLPPIAVTVMIPENNNHQYIMYALGMIAGCLAISNFLKGWHSYD